MTFQNYKEYRSAMTLNYEEYKNKTHVAMDICDF